MIFFNFFFFMVPYTEKLQKCVVCMLVLRRELYEVNVLHFYVCVCFSIQESRIPIFFGSAQPSSPVACSVGNGLRQNCTVTPPPRRHSWGKVSQPVCEERTPTPLEKEDHQKSDIRAQIAKIEQLLSSEGLRPQKRRRVDGFEL